MKKWLKVAGITVLSAVGVGVAALSAGSALADRKMQRIVTVPARAISLEADAAALEHGSYLFRSRGCTECHGANGAGRVFIDSDGLFARAPNITLGRNSAVDGYEAEDWDRTLRHGVKRDGRPLMIMPSEDYSRLTDGDMTALVGYVRSLPAIDGEPGRLELPPMVRALYAFGAIEDSAEKIDHDLPAPKPVPAGATKEHGAYVANMCIGCHGAGFSGGKIPGGPPDWPAAANLTPGEDSAMARYDSAAKLGAMFRTGKRPDGSALHEAMPFGVLKVMNDTDVEALHLYLKTLAPRAAGQR
jgi:mono/diheme cytochrome c family protein